MAITAYQRWQLKKFIKELGRYRARHTELVTVYIPAGYELAKIINTLGQERATAENIKSPTTRKNVIAALEKMIGHLRLVGRTPQNGLAVFSGNVAEREGELDVRAWSIEPPQRLRTKLYHCGKEFLLEPLIDMLEEKEVWGLVVLDSRDAAIALLKGKAIVLLAKCHSHVPGKMKAGGQSALRFQHNRELALKAHLKKTAELIKEQFFGLAGLKGILLGGPGPIKYKLPDLLVSELRQKIAAIRDLSYTEEPGLQELVDRSQDVLAEAEIAEEKRQIGSFLEALARSPEKVTYGLQKVKSALELGAVEKLLVSDSLPEELIDGLEEQAKARGAEFVICSTETREGQQLRDIGGIGAILRWAVEPT